MALLDKNRRPERWLIRFNLNLRPLCLIAIKLIRFLKLLRKNAKFKLLQALAFRPDFRLRLIFKRRSRQFFLSLQIPGRIVELPIKG